MDCNGGYHVADSFFQMGMQFDLMDTFMNFTIGQIREAVNCKCSIPDELSEVEFERRFVPGISAVLNILRGSNKLVDDSDSCPFSLFEHTMNDINFIEFDLPDTCSLEIWESGQPCFIQYNLPSQFDASLQVAVDHCPNSYLPYISFTCGGNGCLNFFKPCTIDSDCGGNLQCYTMHTTTTSQFFSDFYNFLTDMYVYDAEDSYPGCYSVSNIVNYISTFVLSYFTSTEPSSPFSDLRMCGFNVGNLDNLDDDFTNCVVTNSPISDPCNLLSTLYSVSCPNVANWNGTLSDSSSAVSASRKNGLAFKQFNFPTGDATSDVVSILRVTCDGEYNVLGTEEYGLSFGLDPLYIAQSFINLLSDTQLCRFSPPLSLDQFLTAWGMWTADYWSYLFLSPEPSTFTYRSSFLSIFSPATSRLILPSTCTLESWQETGVCAVKWTGLQDLLNMDITIRGRMRKCSNSTGIPEAYLECEGSDCASLFRPVLCNSNSDCSTNFVCKDITAEDSLTYNNFNPLGLLLWGVDQNSSATCPNLGLDIIPPSENCASSLSSYYQMIREAVPLITGRQSTANSGFSLCTFDYDAVNNNANEWASNMVINQGPDFTLQGMNGWSNAFDDEDPLSTTGGLSSTTTGSNSGPNSGGSSGSTTNGKENTANTITISAGMLFLVWCLWIIN